MPDNDDVDLSQPVDIVVNQPNPAQSIAVTETTQTGEAQSQTELASFSETFLIPPETIEQAAALHREYARRWASYPVDQFVEGEKYSAFHYAARSENLYNLIGAMHTAVLNSIAHVDAEVIVYKDAAVKAQAWAEKQTNIEIEPGKYSAKHYATIAAQVLSNLGATVAQIESVANSTLAQALEVEANINAISLAEIHQAITDAEAVVADAQAILSSINASATTAVNAANTAVAARDITTAARDVTVAATEDAAETYENLQTLFTNVDTLLSGRFFNARSTTAVPLALGDVTIVITAETREHFAPSAWMQMVNPNDGRMAQAGTLLSYNPVSGILVMEIYQYYGTGTNNNWIIAPTASPFIPVILDAGVYDSSPAPSYDFVEHRVASLTVGSIGTDGGSY